MYYRGNAPRSSRLSLERILYLVILFFSEDIMNALHCENILKTHRPRVIKKLITQFWSKSLFCKRSMHLTGRQGN